MVGSEEEEEEEKEMSYEECRKQRVEENKKRMEALNLPQLSHSLIIHSPKPSLMKQVKPRTVDKQMVVVRRSSRVANLPAPDYRDAAAECNLMPRFMVTPRRMYKRRDTSGGRVYASAEAREYAFGKAEELESTLGTSYPTFIKRMLPSHVSGGFWLGLPSHFCKTKLPKYDGVMTLVSEEGEEYPTVYLARKNGLSGGWKRFAQSHDMTDGDALVFQLTKPTTMKATFDLLSKSKNP